MPGAFIVINAEVGSEEILLEKIKKIPAVKEAYIVYGVYDLVVRLEANSLTELKEEVSGQIRKIDHVKSTLTMVMI